MDAACKVDVKKLRNLIVTTSWKSFTIGRCLRCMNIFESKILEEVVFFRKEELPSWKVREFHFQTYSYILEIVLFIYFSFLIKSFVVVEITNTLTWYSRGEINRFLRRWKLLFTRANRTIDKIYGTLFVLRERCTSCAMFCQIENTRGIVVRIKQRQRRQISNSTIRKIPPLVKYSKHRTKLPRKQLGKWTWYKNVCNKKPIWVYIIEYLEIGYEIKTSRLKEDNSGSIPIWSFVWKPRT